MVEERGIQGDENREISTNAVTSSAVAEPVGEAVASQSDYDKICALFDVRDGIELSKDERLICYSEPDFMISPLVYGETVHASIAEFLMLLRD